MNERINTFLKVLLIVTCLIGPRIGESQDGFNVDGAGLCSGVYDVNGYYYEHAWTFNGAPFYVGNITPDYEYYIEYRTENGGFWRIRIDDKTGTFTVRSTGFENYTGTNALPPLTGWTAAAICSGATPPVLTFVAPVELVAFDVENKKGLNVLKWETAWEENNEGFEIQYSKNAKDWESIDFKPGMGTYSGTTHYGYEHQEYSTGDNFYRLKQIDYDGRYEYSDVQQVYVNRGNDEISVYPNPSNGERIWIKGLKEKVGYQITSIEGSVVKSGLYQYQGIDVNELKAGIYYVRVGHDQDCHKVVILR